jgi:hypothetical protein
MLAGNRRQEKPMRVCSRLAWSSILIAGLSGQALCAEYLEGNERQKSRAYSPP